MQYGIFQISNKARYVEPPPKPTLEYKIAVKKNNIDIVTHAFSDNNDEKTQQIFFEQCKHIFHKIPYSRSNSTTNILQKIKS